MAYRDHFVIQFCGIVGIVIVVCQRHTLYSRQYLINGLSDLIQIWHVDVTAYQGMLYLFGDRFEGMPYFNVTLNSHVLTTYVQFTFLLYP